MSQIVDCVDAGTAYCPCHLAEIGECIICSQLQGKTFCDCKNWKGVCIYQEYIWNRNRAKERREVCPCRIAQVEIISDAVMIITLEVTRTLARELNQPGAYVFLRSKEEPSYFDVPMSIMTADEERGNIKIAIQVRGAKTKALQQANTEMLLRGPYWNGLLGLKYIKTLKQSRALLVTRGVAQAPAVTVAKKLVHSGNKVEVILDKGRAGANFAEQLFRELGCDIHYFPVLDKGLRIPEETQGFIKQKAIQDEVKLIYSGGTEILHESIAQMINELGLNANLVCSNDARFCCGEGICGSCHIRLKDGNRIKTCKTQLDPMDIYGRRKD